MRFSFTNNITDINTTSIINTLIQKWYNNVAKIQVFSYFFFQWKKQTIEIVSMVTSPTSEKISRSEVKVLGSCQFNTTLPAEEGTYTLFVSVSPGSRQFSVSDKQFTVGKDTIHCLPLIFTFFGSTSVTLTYTQERACILPFKYPHRMLLLFE